jgi:hypothetical protein
MKIKIGCISSLISLIISSILSVLVIEILLDQLAQPPPGVKDLGYGIAGVSIIFGVSAIGVVIFVVLTLILFALFWFKNRRNISKL